MTAVAQAPLHVAIPEEHTLAAKPILPLKDLADTCWILLEKEVHPPVYQTITAPAESEQIRPATIHHILNAEEAFQIASELGGIASTDRCPAVTQHLLHCASRQQVARHRRIHAGLFEEAGTTCSGPVGAPGDQRLPAVTGYIKLWGL